MEEHFAIEDDELELDRDRAQSVGYQAVEFSTLSEVQAMIVAKPEMWTSRQDAPVLAEVVEDTLIDAQKLRYDAAKME